METLIQRTRRKAEAVLSPVDMELLSCLQQYQLVKEQLKEVQYGGFSAKLLGERARSVADDLGEVLVDLRDTGAGLPSGLVQQLEGVETALRQLLQEDVWIRERYTERLDCLSGDMHHLLISIRQVATKAQVTDDHTPLPRAAATAPGQQQQEMPVAATAAPSSSQTGSLLKRGREYLMTAVSRVCATLVVMAAVVAALVLGTMFVYASLLVLHMGMMFLGGLLPGVLTAGLGPQWEDSGDEP